MCVKKMDLQMSAASADTGSNAKTQMQDAESDVLEESAAMELGSLRSGDATASQRDKSQARVRHSLVRTAACVCRFARDRTWCVAMRCSGADAALWKLES